MCLSLWPTDEPIDLAPGGTAELNTTVPTGRLPAGSYTLRVATDDDRATATVEVTAGPNG